MPNEISSNNLIVKNTVILSFRMLIGILVSLYTSRIVLQTLGVADYGIYGVVGGVISMFSFLNFSMSGATSRFMSYEMGKGNQEKLRDTFSSSLIVHIGLALIVFLLGETIGLWFVQNKLVIPEGREFAALVVYQCSIVSMFVSFAQVPYNSIIIAHERMNIYAYIEILNVTLKLLIVYLLSIGNFDKLIFYSILVLCVSMVIALSYWFYCNRFLAESRFRFVWKEDIIIGLTSFSTYNLLGNFGFIFNSQSINFLINIFFGVLLNAASSIANTVSGVVNGFVSNILLVFRPSITKAYAQGNIVIVERLLTLALRSVIIIHSFIVIPLLLELDSVLHLWLGTVPDYASVFCRVILISIYFETIRHVLIIVIHAVGKVKNVSLATGSLFIINPFVLYLLLRNGYAPWVTYISNIVVNVLLILWILWLIHQYVPSIKTRSIVNSILPPFSVALFVYLFLSYAIDFCSTGIVRILISTLLSTLGISVLSFCFCLDKMQKRSILSKIKKTLPFYG